MPAKIALFAALALATLTVGCTTVSTPTPEYPNGKRSFAYLGETDGCRVYVSDRSPDTRVYSVRCNASFGSDPVQFHNSGGKCKVARHLTGRLSDAPRAEYRITCKGTPAEVMQIGGTAEGKALTIGPVPGRNIHMLSGSGWTRK